MATQINPALARIWLPGGIRQYGYIDPAVTQGQSPQIDRVLDHLEAGVSAAQLARLGVIAKSDELTVQSVLERLGGALKHNSGRHQPLTKGEINHHFAELARIYLESAEDPEAVLAKRAKATIFIERFDRTGLTIARGLTASFVGKLISLDKESVSQADTLPIGFSQSDLGHNRVRMAAREMPQTRIEHHSRFSGSMESVDLAILIDSDIANPDSYQPWMTREIPHISIVFDEAGVLVSPLVLPGITPCIGCYERAKIQKNPNWIVIAPQLAALDRSLADSAMLLFASSMVINQALNLIDFGVSNLMPEAFRLNRAGDLRKLTLSEINCGCR